MSVFTLTVLLLVSRVSSSNETDEHAFLQTQLNVATPQPTQPALAATSLLLSAKPIAWVHIPKAGTSLINSLALLPGVCPALDKAAVVTEDKQAVRLDEDCPSSFLYENIQGHATAMGRLQVYRQSFVGHSVGMFRQPEQRILSAYYYEWGFYLWDTPPKNAVEYAHWAQGATVKMLTRVGDYYEWLKPFEVTDAEVALAHGRVREAFVFVGITDQWDLSMCLLHAKLGGPCRSADFQNSRPGVESSSDDYNTTELNGFVDVYDGPVYAEALEVFNRDLQMYGVSMESCRTCFEDATNLG